MEKIKLDWVNNGKEFILPDLTNDKDMQTALDLLCINRDIELKYKKYKPEGERPDFKKIKDLPDEWIFYLNAISSQMNLDRAFYVLHKIDDNVTKEQVSKMGICWIAEFNSKLFPDAIDETVFQEAETDRQKKTIVQKQKN